MLLSDQEVTNIFFSETINTKLEQKIHKKLSQMNQKKDS